MSAAGTVALSPGETLFRRGDPGGDLYIVLDGRLAAVDGRTVPETVIAEIAVGDAVGEMTVIDGAPRSSDVRAQERSTCAHWRRAELLALLEANPGLGSAFYRALAVRVIDHARVVTTSAIAGAFASPPSPKSASATPGAPDSGHIEQALRSAIALAAAHADHAGRVALLEVAVERTSRWYCLQADPFGPNRAGELLRAALGEALEGSTAGSAMLARRQGTLPSPELLRHLCSGLPSGTNPLGAALDTALLGLPTSRGLRWRCEALVSAAGEAFPSEGKARIVAVNCAATSLAGLLRLRGEQQVRVVCVEASADAARYAEKVIAEAGAGVDAEVVTEDLTRMATGRSVQFWTNQHAVIVDGLADLLPESVLVAVLGWAVAQVGPGGALLTTHLTPADDASMFADLLRMPLVRRRAQLVGELLAIGGRGESRLIESPDAAIPGLVGVTRIPAASP